jgi:hypothetical protein
MNILQKLAQILAPNATNYLQQSTQQSLSDMPSGQFARGGTNPNILKFLQTRAQETVANPQAFKSGAELASWMIPFGKGATLGSKVLLPGASVGALQGLASEQPTPRSVATSTALGAGGAYGMGKLEPLVGKAMNVVTNKIPEDIMTKMLRPSQTKSTKAAVKSTLKGAKSTGQEALERGFKGSNLENMYKQALTKMEGLENNIQNAIKGSKETISSKAIVSKITPYYEKLLQSGNTEAADKLLNRAIKIFEVNGDEIPLSTANQVKRTLYQEARNGYDKLASEQVEGLKKIGNAFMTEIESKVKGIKPLNKDYSFYLKAEDALLNQMSRGTRNLSVGLTDYLAGGIGAAIGGLPGAVVGVGLKKGLASPGFQSNSANLLYKAGQTLEGVAPKIQPTADYLVGQLGARGASALADIGAGNERKDSANQGDNQKFDESQIPSFPGVNFTTPQPQDANLPSFSQIGSGESGVPQDGQLSPEGQWIYSAEQGDWIPNPTAQTGLNLDSGLSEEQKMAIAQASLTMPAGEFSKFKEAYKIMTGQDLIPEEAEVDKKTEDFRNSLNQSVSQMESLYLGTKPGESLSIGKNTVGLSGAQAKLGRKAQMQLDQNYVNRLNRYKMVQAQAIGILNRARGAGALNANEFDILIQNMPNEYTEESVAKDYFNQLRQLFQYSTPATTSGS